MNYSEGKSQQAEYRRQIADLRAKMRAAQQATAPQPVTDYTFASPAGPVHLADLFGAHDDLILIHNMGKGCSACTMWADGYNGVYAHLADRAAFVVTSPDPVEVQVAFASGRGWRFPMVSHAGTSFAADMGYVGARGGYVPGVSTFRRQGGKVVRIADSAFDHGDTFCSVWPLFDLLPDGGDNWHPKLSYETPAPVRSCCGG